MSEIKTLTRGGLSLAVFATLGMAASGAPTPSPSPLPFDMPSVQALRQSPHKVFAHYVAWSPISLDNSEPNQDYYQVNYDSPHGEGNSWLKRDGLMRDRPLPLAPRKPGIDAADFDFQTDVHNAIADGLDGFTLDLVSYSAPGTPENDSWRRSKQLIAAAHTADPGFAIVLVPDTTGTFSPGSDPLGDKLTAAMTELGDPAKYPAVYHLADGRLVVAPFFGGDLRTKEWWQSWADRMAAQTPPVRIALMPIFQGANRQPDWASMPALLGFSNWGDNVPGNNQTDPNWWGTARQVHAMPVPAGRPAPLWMAPTQPQANLPSQGRYTEAGNTALYRITWDNAAVGTNAKGAPWSPADWVQVVTWNDYGEGTEIAPSSGTQYLFSDLTAYYVTRLKMRSAPIVRDVLYFCHRKQHSTAGYDPSLQTGGAFVPQNSSIAATDDIELLAFLKSPGTLRIEFAGQTHTQNAPAGITSFRVPFTPDQTGRPTFSLERGGKTISSVTSPFAITNPTPVQDFLYRGGSDTRARPVTVTADNRLLSYGGKSWRPLAGQGDVQGTDTDGDSVEYAFSGTGIDFIADKTPTGGALDFYVDGSTKVETVNCAGTGRRQVVFRRTGLPFGVHTLRAVKSGGPGKTVTLDALRVYND